MVVPVVLVVSATSRLLYEKHCNQPKVLTVETGELYGVALRAALSFSFVRDLSPDILRVEYSTLLGHYHASFLTYRLVRRAAARPATPRVKNQYEYPQNSPGIVTTAGGRPRQKRDDNQRFVTIDRHPFHYRLHPHRHFIVSTSSRVLAMGSVWQRSRRSTWQSIRIISTVLSIAGSF
ncbi:hypothetical protein Y032_0041g466 [Ancylostoma ceylanicum]|uniref:Uncharacterized protein n=1 Tax=Ancylostoma ceylanicum TaxID=53326 RepID=A0A016UG38_9BILA|nr:hypothetical protein Y032_0041g466 [Ancylostoma ceylanicum]